ncbi:MAG: ankyrin repeat domain-containing protein [Candidatus Endonucleobacter sp. (ex Gigantidas childressi)]|nr:ankyrin repeat domain-containing protein [Candidatus Endonucleobacter sp. (ex Gigantidas childressi)]
MKKLRLLIVTLGILVSGSSISSLGAIVEQIANFEVDEQRGVLSELISLARSNTDPCLNNYGPCDLPKLDSLLDDIISNKSSIPESWLPQLSQQQDAKLKTNIETIDEQEFRDLLNNTLENQKVADKIFGLRDHVNFHYILCYTVIELLRPCSTESSDAERDLFDEDAIELPEWESIIQRTIESFNSTGRALSLLEYPNMQKINNKPMNAYDLNEEKPFNLDESKLSVGSKLWNKASVVLGELKDMSLKVVSFIYGSGSVFKKTVRNLFGISSNVISSRDLQNASEVEEGIQGLEQLSENSFSVSAIDGCGYNESNIFGVSYKSEGQEYNFCSKICPGSDETLKIQSGHLCEWWLNLEELNYDDVNSEDSILECLDINRCDFIKLKVMSELSSEAIYFEINQFHQVLLHEAAKLNKGQEKKYFLGSNYDVMALRIKRNQENNIIIYYYDPYDTCRHLEVIVNNEHHLKYLTAEHFWSIEDRERYFQGPNKVCCLLSPDTKTSRDDCSVVCMAGPSPELTCLLSVFGHYGHSGIPFDLNDVDTEIREQLIAGINAKGFSALLQSVRFGRHEAVAACIDTICCSNLRSSVRESLMAPDNKSLLIQTCDNFMLKTLLDGAHDLQLSPTARAKLLTDLVLDTAPIISACLYGTTETVALLFEEAHKIDCELGGGEKLEWDQTVKAALVTAKEDSTGRTALFIACGAGNRELVTLLLKWVCNDNIGLDAKKEFLAASRYDGVTALAQACATRDVEIVTELLKAINSITDMTVKEELFDAKSWGGQPVITVTAYAGVSELITLIINAVLSSKLDFDVQERLIMGNHIIEENDEVINSILVADAANHLGVAGELYDAIVFVKSNNLMKIRRKSYSWEVRPSVDIIPNTIGDLFWGLYLKSID